MRIPATKIGFVFSLKNKRNISYYTKKAQNDQQSGKHFIELNDLRFGQNNSPSSGSIKKQ